MSLPIIPSALYPEKLLVHGRSVTPDELLAGRQGSSLESISFQAQRPSIQIQEVAPIVIQPTPLISSEVDFSRTPPIPTPSAPRRSSPRERPPALTPSLPSSLSGYRSPGRITRREEILIRSPAREATLSIPQAPPVPVVNIQVVRSIHPNSALPPSPMIAAPPLATPVVAAGGTPLSPSSVPSLHNRPNYAGMSLEQQQQARQLFHSKFETLRLTYRNRNIVEPPSSTPLDQVHDAYAGVVKNIILEMNRDQWKVYLVVFFLIVELICTYVLKLNMSGFTMAQIKKLQAYDELFISLGEKYYAETGGQWPVELRCCLTIGFHILVFLAIRGLANKVGGSELANVVQGVIDQLMGGNGPSSSTAASPSSTDEFGVPVPPAASGGGGTDLMGMLGGLLGGGGGEGGLNLDGILSGLGNFLGQRGGGGGGEGSTAPRNVVFDS